MTNKYDKKDKNRNENSDAKEGKSVKREALNVNTDNLAT